MSKVILICGKIASGKTYYANYLKEKENAVILSTDEVIYDLTNNEQGEGYDAFAKKVNNYLRKKALEIVKCGCNVILDWGFWTKEDRKNITEYFNENSAEIEWHYIDIDDDTWYKNIEERNKLVEEGKGGSSFYVDEGLLNKLLTMFEEPEKGEMDFIYKLKRQKIERNEKMQYLDKYKKEQFRNVYFITGTATGGKTTISNELSKKYGFFRYDVDEEFDKHQKLSNPKDKPAMNKTFRNADEFFLRPKDEYVDWLLKNTQEQMEFILDDLIELSRNQIVVCDLHLTVEEAEKIANENQVVFLIRESNDNIIEDYCNRKSHEGFNKFINSSTNPSLAKKNCNEVLKDINEKRCNDIKASKFLWIERNENSTIEKTLELVEKHFGLIDKDISREKIIEIKKVDNNTELKNKLLEFIKKISWQEVKEHTLNMIENWSFEEWETPFVALIDGKVVGMITIMKTDYYPLTEIYPWLSTIFVTEEYRGNKISSKLIDYANNYAKKLGFDSTYIPTEYVGLYEKYGYRYVKDIVNYANGIDRLYVKKLK